MFNWGPGPAAGDEFSKPLSLAKCTWAQHSWTALATQIFLFFRSLCLFIFTLIPVWLSHAMCRSKVRGNGNPSWGWGYNLRRSPHYVGGGEWSPPSFTEVIHFQRQYCTWRGLMEMQWFPVCAMKCYFMATRRVTDIWGVLVFFYLKSQISIPVHWKKKLLINFTTNFIKKWQVTH